jgi:hypothetical protein
MVIRALCCVLLGVGTLLGCNVVLGIDEAHVDRRLVGDGRDASVTSGSAQEIPLALQTSDPPDAATDGTLLDAGEVGEGEPIPSCVTGLDRLPVLEAPEDAGVTPEPEPDAGPNDTEHPDADVIEGMTSDPAMSQPEGGAVPSEPTSLCADYCEDIMTGCTEDLLQYRDMAQCMKVCSYFPEGELSSNEDDNTVACRLRAASRARYAGGTELVAYCREAGPGGDGTCGSNCDGYCTLMMGVCTAKAAGNFRYDSADECLQVCDDLPLGSVSYSVLDPEVSDGNHVQCRLFHVTSAAMLDAEEHCEHAMGVVLCEEG